MKKYLLFMITLFSLIACKLVDKKSETPLTDKQKTAITSDSLNFTSIKWIDSTFLELGKVKEGEVVEVAYRFQNTGKKNLIITEVRPGCGCTVTEKPQEPFAPGAIGYIKGKFNSKGHPGPNSKSISVESNSLPNSQVLFFHVDVTPEKN